MIKKILKGFALLIGIIIITPYLIPIEMQPLDPEFHLFEDSDVRTILGTDIHFRVQKPEGDKKGNILFVHGFSGSTFNWRYQTEYFAERGYLTVAVDLPGFGFSQKGTPFDHSNTNRSRILKALYTQLAPGEKWTIVGHSMGGGTAIYGAALDREHIERLVIVAGALGRIEHNSGIKLMQYIMRFPPIVRWGEAIGKHFFYNLDRFQGLTSSAYGREASEEEALGYLKPFKIKGSATSILQMAAYSKPEADINLETDIEVPTQIIWGNQDNWVPISFGKKLNEKMDHAYFYVIENAGHCPMETHHEEFNRVLGDFLEKES